MVDKENNTEMTMVKEFTFYYGMGRILLAAKSFYLNRSKNNYKRLSVTFILACNEPFTLETGDGTRLTTRAVLIAPNVERSILDAQNRDILIFDIPIQSKQYHKIVHLFDGKNLVEPSIEPFEEIIQEFDQIYSGIVGSKEIIDIYERVVSLLSTSLSESISSVNPSITNLDKRVEKVMQELENTPLEQTSLETLAESVHLSPSRLRHLFKHELGCTISHYARWINVWKAVELWSMGKTFTDVAEVSGFYDIAHLSRAFIDIFGLSPSDFLKSKGIKFIKIST